MRFKPANGFPQRHATRVEAGGELGFEQTLAWAELFAGDHQYDCFRDLIGQRPNAGDGEIRGWWRRQMRVGHEYRMLYTICGVKFGLRQCGRARL